MRTCVGFQLRKNAINLLHMNAFSNEKFDYHYQKVISV